MTMEPPEPLPEDDQQILDLLPSITELDELAGPPPAEWLDDTGWTDEEL
jgi:hypothetical protein